jgi:hypothetical protein
MIIGRINQRVKELISKDKFNEIDIKLIKGIFKKSQGERKKKKGLKETFNPYVEENSTVKNAGIVRKFKDFVLRDSLADLQKSRDQASVLESIEHYLDKETVHEIVDTYANPLTSQRYD